MMDFIPRDRAEDNPYEGLKPLAYATQFKANRRVIATPRLAAG